MKAETIELETLLITPDAADAWKALIAARVDGPQVQAAGHAKTLFLNGFGFDITRAKGSEDIQIVRVVDLSTADHELVEFEQPVFLENGVMDIRASRMQAARLILDDQAGRSVPARRSRSGDNLVVSCM